MKIEIRTCVGCGQMYRPRGPQQKYCSPCIPRARRDGKRKWKKDNPEKVKAQMHDWREKNPEKVKVSNASWRAINPERFKETSAAWRKTPQGKERLRREIAKHRELGFNPLNSWFIGSEGHHINLTDVIYIPKRLHMSVRHNVKTGKNMDKINALAGAYLTEDWT